jgi:hypothetical protein
MRVLGWAFFGLAIIVVLGYVLTKGVYVGNSIDELQITDIGTRYYKNCFYLYPSGVRKIEANGGSGSGARAAAETFLCSFWGDSTKYVLLVTMIATAQTPFRYDVEFSSRDSCEAAQKSVIASYGRYFSSFNYSILCVQKTP